MALHKYFCPVKERVLLHRDVFCRAVSNLKYSSELNFEDPEAKDENLRKEEKIKHKQDKSRLMRQHRNMLKNCRPYSDSKSLVHDTVRYNAKLYGTYGEASGVNPGICWPTHNELAERKEYESIAYPQTLNEMIEKNLEIKKEKEIAIKKREEEIAMKLERLANWKEELLRRAEKQEAVAMASKMKKERLIEEVRRYFGFKVDPREERFKEMLEKKEREERKLEKEARKRAREAKSLAKLTEMSAQSSQDAEKPVP